MNLIAKLFPKRVSINVDFCTKNVDRFFKDEDERKLGKVLNQKGVHYKEYTCQSQCKVCKSSPYVMVNGKLITADDSTELIYKIEQFHQGMMKG